jgi:hypothetical protein
VAGTQNAGSVVAGWPCKVSLCVAAGWPQFAARPSWRPAARIFTGQGLWDASGQRPSLIWDVTARGSACGEVLLAHLAVSTGLSRQSALD